jgi:hypothetical protein
MVETHRKGAGISFASVFENHVAALSVRAIAEDKEKTKDRKPNQTKKIAPNA